jgi:REP element-mobilizing transposase RayT
MRHFFGEISDNGMYLSPIGSFLSEELSSPHRHHDHIDIPLFVVMPNHIHAIITVGTRRAASARDLPPAAADMARQSAGSSAVMARHVPTLLGSYIASLKSAVTRYAHMNNIPFAWQPRYHDHIIRGIDDLNNIGDYIENNVAHWSYDRFNQ